MTWAEAARVSVEIKNGKAWLLIDPDIWIWPRRARRIAVDFMDKRRGDRFNSKYNLSSTPGLKSSLGRREPRRGSDGAAPFTEDTTPRTPSFHIGSRTAFAWRLSA